ncbi:fucolectin-like [Anomaloglossus baeobatrachus]|uniref:fucolectin-like n=1 Tax=Anomaloglossus baeobatrachus TaxID=238106 RepID=UPI003F50510D
MKLLFLVVLLWMVCDGAATAAESMDDEDGPSTMEEQESKASSPICEFAESMDDEEFPSTMEEQGSEASSHICRYKNLALRGRATQSTILVSELHGFRSMAINAIDGNLDAFFDHGSCSHTNNDWSPWWRVDLLESHRITHIIITNRQDCCAERLNGAEILIGDSLSDNGNNNPRCAVVTANAHCITQTFNCHNMVGRYVNIILRGKKEYLHLCEVQIFGTKQTK